MVVDSASKPVSSGSRSQLTQAADTMQPPHSRKGFAARGRLNDAPGVTGDVACNSVQRSNFWGRWLYVCKSCKHQRWARATFFWVHIRNSAQSQFCNLLRNVAPQPQLRNSAISVFSAVRNFKSATWKLHFRNFRHIFGRGIRSIHEKKSEVKNLVQLSF